MGLWQKINSLLHPGSSHTTILISVSVKEFFTGKLKTIRQTITTNIASSTPRFFRSSCQAGSIPVMSQFSSVSAVEVEKLLSSLPNKTSQMDILPINIVKQFQVDIAVYISHLANASFVTGRFPQSMKHGVVLPLLKKTWARRVTASQLSTNHQLNHLVQDIGKVGSCARQESDYVLFTLPEVSVCLSFLPFNGNCIE
jgi:hypothetical protein